MGSKVTDTVTGITGVATSRTVFLHKCVRIEVQPKGKDNTKVLEPGFSDEANLKTLSANDVVDTPEEPFLMGKMVKDRISGYSGTVVGYTEYIAAAPHFIVRANDLVEGKPHQYQFDAMDLMHIDAKGKEIVVPAAAVIKRGGPARGIPTRAMVTR